MGFETELFTSLTFNRMTLDSKYAVEGELSETERLIKFYEERLHSLAVMTEPKKFCDEDDDVLSYVDNEFKNTIKELEDCYIERFKLSLVLETWDKSHDENGYAIRRPENVSWDAAYIEGDYIKHKEE